MAHDLTATQKKAITVRDYINQPQIVKQIEAALPSFLNADNFLRTFYTAMLRNPALLDCTKESMLSALIESAQLGLPPVLRKAALVPYGKEVQFQPMYGGLIELARRTERIKITAHVVYEKDDFDYGYGTDDYLRHKPCEEEDAGKMIGAYTVWTFIDSDMQTFLFMPAHQILKVRAVSKAWQKAQREPKNQRAQETPWVQWEDQQSIKTVIKRHSKLQPCSIEMERAVHLDDRVEAGLSQSDMLGNFDGFSSSPEPKTKPEGKVHDQHLIDKFNTMVKEKDDVDSGNLDEYLKLSAETQQGTTIEDVKAFVVSKKGFTGFWDFYQSWEGYKPAKKAGPKEGKHSAFMQQFINLRKGDGENTGLLPAIIKNKAAIQAASTEDQDAIRKKFHDVYGPDVEYPIDKKPELPIDIAESEDVSNGESNGAGTSELSKEEKEAKVLNLVDGSKRDDMLGIVVPCPNREGDLIKMDMCDACLYDLRVGCPTWSKYDNQVGD